MAADRRGGPGDRVVVDPRGSARARAQRQLDGDDPISAPPPGLLGPDGDLSFRLPHTPLGPLPPAYLGDEGPDPYQSALRLRARPNHRSDRKSPIRVYHRLEGAPLAGTDGRCWAFTITRVAWERLVTERVLDSDGATYPDGTPIAPPGTDPLYVPVRCGSCGTQNVECLQMEFWES